ncbi:MAG: hypothetical protein K0R00_934 [Herbinix sp.]|jgi:hypothetical protein|nr:hypothetical protein [Herbinix sp.]
MFMEANEKNAETVKKIIKILSQEGYTVQEAYSILDFTKGRIEHTSKVGKDTSLSFSQKVSLNKKNNELVNLPSQSKIPNVKVNCSYLGCKRKGIVPETVEVAPGTFEKQLVCKKHKGQLNTKIALKGKRIKKLYTS